VKRFNVKPGSEVEIEEHDKVLQVSTERGPEFSNIIIDISGLSSSVIWRYILSAYRAGYDEITITGLGKGRGSRSAFSQKTNIDYINNRHFTVTSPTNIIQLATSSVLRSPFDSENTLTPIEVISACVNRLIGMEIIDQKEGYCKIKELGETTYKEFENAVRRIFILLNTECEYIRNGLDGRNDDLNDILTVDTNLDRFEDFCMRVLNKKGYSEFRKTSTMYAIVFMLELIGDDLKKIGCHVLDNGKPHSKVIKELFSERVEQLERLGKLFYRFDKEKIHEIYAQSRRNRDRIEKALPGLSDYEKELAHHFKKIGIFIINLTELRIDLEI